MAGFEGVEAEDAVQRMDDYGESVKNWQLIREQAAQWPSADRGFAGTMPVTDYPSPPPDPLGTAMPDDPWPYQPTSTYSSYSSRGPTLTGDTGDTGDPATGTPTGFIPYTGTGEYMRSEDLFADLVSGIISRSQFQVFMSDLLTRAGYSGENLAIGLSQANADADLRMGISGASDARVESPGTAGAGGTGEFSLSRPELRRKRALEASQTRGGRRGTFGEALYGSPGYTQSSPIARGILERQFDPLSAQYALTQAGGGTPQTFGAYLGGQPQPFTPGSWRSALEATQPLFAEGATLSPIQEDFRSRLEDDEVARNIISQSMLAGASPLAGGFLPDIVTRRGIALRGQQPDVSLFQQYLDRGFSL